MKSLLFIPVIVLAALAQPKPDAAKPKTPPELQALRDARKIKDPDARLAAFDALIKKYPKHFAATDARYARIEAALEKSKDDRAFVLKLAGDYIKAQQKPSRSSAMISVARLLLDSNVHLDQAERYAREALDNVKQDKIYNQARKEAKAAKRPEPSEAELKVRFDDARSGAVETLGLVTLAQDRTAEGKQMLEEALRTNLARSRAAEALAGLYEKGGDEPKALEHLYVAQLSGRIRKQAREDLERLHRKANGGSIEGLEATLDRVYREKFPPPLHAEPYTSASRTGRVVLAEVFTGAGCPPCAAADLAFDVVMERYKRSDVAVLMYHQHIPRPDPMTNPEAEARFKWYARGGVPAYVVDGKVDGGGGPRAYAPVTYAKINGGIEKRLGSAPGATIRLDASERNGIVEAHVAVENAGSAVKAAKLHVVLAEKELRYTGENGIRFHPMVVRSHKEFDVELSAPSKHTHRFDSAAIAAEWKKYLDEFEAERSSDEKFEFRTKMHGIDAKHLVVVAFVQDPESKDVLQSIYVDPQAPAVISNR